VRCHKYTSSKFLCFKVSKRITRWYSSYGGIMDTQEIIQQIDAEISKLQQAKSLLLGADSPVKRSPGRPNKKATVSRIIAVKPTKHVLSPEGRARIAVASKARWAKARKAKKSATAKA
jgi:hypothetical protein